MSSSEPGLQGLQARVTSEPEMAEPDNTNIKDSMWLDNRTHQRYGKHLKHTMAAGRKKTDDESLLCALCLDVFRTPKILPCLHTFCELCLQHLIGGGSTVKFCCPTCREEVAVPLGGASGLKNNVYILTDDLDKARNRVICANHPKMVTEIYCVQCDALICSTCAVTIHKGQDAEDIELAVHRLKTRLQQDQPQLHHYVQSLKTDVEDFKQEQQALKDKKAALTAAIISRHDTLKAAIEQYRDEALGSLEKVSLALEAGLSSRSEVFDKNLRELSKLEKQLHEALKGDNASDLETVARETRLGRCGEKVVRDLMNTRMTTVCRPVLSFSASLDATLQSMRDYIGLASKMEMAVSPPEFTVVEQLRCRADPDVNVGHLCPMTNDSVWVSYECKLRSYSLADPFGADGAVIFNWKCDIPGVLTTARRKNGKALYTVCTFAKKCEPNMIRFFRLDSDPTTEHATVKLETIVVEDPPHTEVTDVLTINSTAHRAFDVDASEQVFVVLEDDTLHWKRSKGKTADFQRRVQLYRWPFPDTVATYSPSANPFQPSDVCFYTLGGQEALLVADELNDAIHVVTVHNRPARRSFRGKKHFLDLVFLRYLAPHCPLLVQPTALNTDTRGRLWVACRGGSILTCTPISSTRANNQTTRL